MSRAVTGVRNICPHPIYEDHEVRTQALSCHCDPTDVYWMCTAGKQTPGTCLLETAETPQAASSAGKSLIVTQSALHIICTGYTVRVRALSYNGRNLLAKVGHYCDEQSERHIDLIYSDAELTCRYPPPPPSASEEERLFAPSPTDILRILLGGLSADAEHCERRAFSLPLVVGTFAYDFLAVFEQLPPPKTDTLKWPDFEFWLPEALVWLDHQRNEARVVIHTFDNRSGPHPEHNPEAIETALCDNIAQCAGQNADFEDNGQPAEPSSGHDESPALVHIDIDDKTYAALVERLKEHIVAGDVFQIVPSRTFSAPCTDPLSAYRRLRAQNPSPYMFFIRGTSGILFGTSPETAVAVDGSPRKVHIRPLAGTRPRGRTFDELIEPDLDGRLECELRLNEKEVAEHLMLVDLARNDVARVSEPGSRYVEELLQTERYSRVMHLSSHVCGRLRQDLDALHAYVATMNMGTLVGAPKVRAAQLLRHYERDKRGPYGGAVGYLRADGQLDTGIVIRSAVVRDQIAYTRAGAGVVYDSDPIAETEETCRKADAILRSLRSDLPTPPGTKPTRHPDKTPRPNPCLNILFIDNFDSFSFNLVDEMRRRGSNVQVWRNDVGAEKALEIALALPEPRLIMLSPGPGRPESAGSGETLVRMARGKIPIVGICLGMQTIVHALGGTIGAAGEIVHGKAVWITHNGQGPFSGLPSRLQVGRYHSLVALKSPQGGLPDGLEEIASYGALTMAVLHRQDKLIGFQFHPESILSPCGGELIDRVLAWAAEGT